MIRTLLFGLFILTSHMVNAAFTHRAQWKLDSIELTYAGTPCFRPGSNPMPAPACANSTLSALLYAHINNNHGPGLSIAYYDLSDGTILGGAGWADWNGVVLPVGVCMSGMVDGFDDAYRTTCRFAISDNDQDSASVHMEECTVNYPQLRVTDGCYTQPTRSARFRLDDSASGILTIIGLLIALPGIVFGTYRWYCARQALQEARIEDGRGLPLVPIGSGGVVNGLASQVSPRQASATLEG